MSRLHEIRAALAEVSDPATLLAQLCDGAPFGLQLFAADGRCLFSNDAFGQLIGRPTPPGYNLYRDPRLCEVARRAFSGETIVRPPLTWLPLRDHGGRVTQLALIHRELSDAAPAGFGDAEHEPTAAGRFAAEVAAEHEERLRQSEARFTHVFAALPMGALFSRLRDRRFLEVNEAWLRMTGYSRAETLNHTSLELGLWSDVGQRERLFDELERHGRVRDFAARMRTKSGALRDVLLSVDRTQLDGDACLLLLAHDVTDLRQLERELRQSQKMEAVGRLAGGVAHDFNNILTAISGAGGLLLDGMAGADPLRRFAEQIKRSTARAATLTRQLLAFTAKQPAQPELLDPNEALRAIVDMLQRMIGADIAIFAEFQARGQVKADPGALEQVLLNLAVNARDAMPGGGRLTLRTHDICDGAASATLTATRRSDGVPDGDWVLLGVSDSGVGMDATTRGRAFEPFYTTKEQGKGTGLGLSTVYGIVKQAGGHIAVDSEPGKGAHFRVYLPRHAERAEPAPAEPIATAPPAGHETVLLAEDDEAVRDYVAFVLGRLGYRVLQAADGRAALELAAAYDGRIDLLLSDVVMPYLDGRELARQLVEARPGLKVIHMSGYPGDSVELAGSRHILGKPFEREELARRVRQTLDAPL